MDEKHTWGSYETESNTVQNTNAEDTIWEMPLNNQNEYVPTTNTPEDGYVSMKKYFSKIGMPYFLYGAMAITGQLIIWVILDNFFPQLLNMESLQWIASIVPMYGIAFPITILILKRIPYTPYEKKKVSFMEMAVYFLMSYSIMYIGNFIGIGLSFVIDKMTGVTSSNSISDLIMSSSPLATMLVAVILAPIIEELLFRKLLIDRISVYGDKVAILVSGTMFGLFHGNLFQFFYAFGLGCMLAYIYVKSRDIKYSIILHMLINFVGSIIPLIVLSQIDMELLEQISASSTVSSETIQILFNNLPGLVLLFIYEITVIALIILGLVLGIMNRKKFSLAPGQITIPRNKVFSVICANAGMILFFCLCLFLFIQNHVLLSS